MVSRLAGANHLEELGNVGERVPDEHDVGITGRIRFPCDAQFRPAGAMADQEPGMAVRAGRDLDRHATDRLPARPDLIEIHLAEHHGPQSR